MIGCDLLCDMLVNFGRTPILYLADVEGRFDMCMCDGLLMSGVSMVCVRPA